MGVLVISRPISSMAMWLASTVKTCPPWRPVVLRIPAGLVEVLTNSEPSSLSPSVTATVPSRVGSRTTTTSGVSICGMDADGPGTEPGKGADGGAHALGPIVGESLEVLAAGQGRLGQQLAGGHHALPAATVPADLYQVIHGVAPRVGMLGSCRMACSLHAGDKRFDRLKVCAGMRAIVR